MLRTTLNTLLEYYPKLKDQRISLTKEIVFYSERKSIVNSVDSSLV